MVVRQGEKEPFIKNVFTLDNCAPVVGSEVICFSKKKEADLLKVGVVGAGHVTSMEGGVWDSWAGVARIFNCHQVPALLKNF